MPRLSGQALEGVNKRISLSLPAKRGPTIAVSGPPGSGKTTYAKRLAEDLGLEYHSAGAIFRHIASERNISLEELSRLAEKDPSIDLEIDRRTLELGLRGGIVVDGHLVAWVLRNVADVKIYVTAPLGVRVERIASREGRRIREVYEETLVRESSNWRRYNAYYGYDITDLTFFDLVLNTENLGIEEAYGIIRDYTCRVLGGKGYSLKGCKR